MGKKYRPIACHTYDELELLAMRGEQCIIVYRDEEGAQITISGRIADLFAKEKVEYMKLENGLVIRLDQLVSARARE